MINKGILPGLIAACILLGAGPLQGAEESADTLIAKIVSGAETNAARASKLLEAAKTIADQPKLCAALLEKAVEFGLKPRVTPDSSQIASQALKLLQIAAPDRKDDWTMLQTDTLRTEYNSARKPKKRREIGGRFLDTLMAAASICENRCNWSGATKLYREARRVEAYMKTGVAGDIRRKLKISSSRAIIAQRIKRYTAALKKDASNVSIRTTLIKALAVDSDDPKQASEHLNASVDETWRTNIPLACKPLGELAETQCRELGDWYYKDLTKSCSTTAKPAMLARAMGYYQQFLTLHPKNDIEAITVKAALMAIDKTGVKTTASAKSIGSIDLIESFDASRHGVSWKWSVESGVLIGAAGTGPGKAMLPWMPEGSYELKIVFVKKEGKEMLIMFPVGGGSTALRLGTHNHPSLVTSAKPHYKGIGGSAVLVNGKEYTMLIKVIVQGDQAAIQAALNDKLVLSWKGDPAQISPQHAWRLPDTRTIGLGVYKSRVDFKQATLKMTSGQAKKWGANKATKRK